jgi:acetyl-CoA acetyltransferase
MGLAMFPAQDVMTTMRLEEMVYQTAREALDQAGVTRSQIDHVTLACSDEIDARSISSMLLAAPAGAYLKDEMRVTDSGLTGLHLGAMRVASGDLSLGLVVSWNQSSVVPLEDIARMRAEPFFLRPVGMNFAIAEGLYAHQAQFSKRIDENQVAQRIHERMTAAQRNPMAVRRTPETTQDIQTSPMVAYPLRQGHRAGVTDGAVALVLASGDWVRVHPQVKPWARIAATSWTVNRYQLSAERLDDTQVFKTTLDESLSRAGLSNLNELDVVELEAQTGWVDLVLSQVFETSPSTAISPSGGAWAQNPYFCTGLVNAAEAILQVSGRAGAHQVPAARYALGHGTSGFSQQTHGFALFERVEA